MKTPSKAGPSAAFYLSHVSVSLMPGCCHRLQSESIFPPPTSTSTSTWKSRPGWPSSRWRSRPTTTLTSPCPAAPMTAQKWSRLCLAGGKTLAPGSPWGRWANRWSVPPHRESCPGTSSAASGSAGEGAWLRYGKHQRDILFNLLWRL